LSLSLKQAEEVKIVCGLDKKKCQGSLRKILHDRVDELVKNIKNTSNFYKNHFPYANKVGKVLIVGGGANLINIDEVLSQKLDLPVESGNLFANLSAPDGKTPIAKEKALSFATAIGLALRGLNEKEL
jgi:Tfp pilus assembly PilM family ATPase